MGSIPGERAGVLHSCWSLPSHTDEWSAWPCAGAFAADVNAWNSNWCWSLDKASWQRYFWGWRTGPQGERQKPHHWGCWKSKTNCWEASCKCEPCADHTAEPEDVRELVFTLLWIKDGKATRAWQEGVQYCYQLATCTGCEEQLVFYTSSMAGRLSTSRWLPCVQALKEHPNATQC